MRFITAIILNVLVPGSGLVLLGRARAGLVAAVLFAICAELALCGVLIAPAAIPAWLTVAAGAMAAGTWLLGQWMLKDRLGTLRNPAFSHELETIRTDAVDAIERGAMVEAMGLLKIALDIDPDATETVVLWARLMTLLGRFNESRRAWHRVLRRRDDRFSREAITALERLPAN